MTAIRRLLQRAKLKTELAEKAHCPVAVLRAELDQPPPDLNWIAVRMTDAPGNDGVVKYAAWEAKLRRAPMLVRGGRPEELTEQADGAFPLPCAPCLSSAGKRQCEHKMHWEKRIRLAAEPRHRLARHDYRHPRHLGNGFAD